MGKAIAKQADSESECSVFIFRKCTETVSELSVKKHLVFCRFLKREKVLFFGF